MSYFDNIRTFVRVYELGSMSAAGRDLRISPAVTSSRISQLEEYLGVRLFQRTTRNLNATEQGEAFYRGACEVLEAIEVAEAQVTEITDSPRCWAQADRAASVGFPSRVPRCERQTEADGQKSGPYHRRSGPCVFSGSA
jgi:DNA-binding transcriptional LysR family regulator